ncbi:MAG TPA: hypothetical protein VFE62_21255 [Gemmataceae bacterium]|nr:hypothetical protein [Gemmataceae bacterium]
MTAYLAEALQAEGWTAHTPLGPFTKGAWELGFDTSHWMILSTKDNPRVFDVPLPDQYHVGWTVNLVEHLCRVEDERVRLRMALGAIRDMSGVAEAGRAAATGALAECYHSWLINVGIPEGHLGRVFCPICGRRAAEPESP